MELLERNEAQRIETAKWLNTQGYDIELDKDGFWMEEYRFQDCKTKEVIDHMIDFSKVKIRELLVDLREKGTIENDDIFNFYLFTFCR